MDTIADIAFIGYDIYSLYQNPGWDTAAALGLDVVGAAIPFVTGLGQVRHLTDIANRADAAIDATHLTPQVARTLKHTQAELMVKAELPNLNTEISYLGGELANRGTKGSVRLDVVDGPLSNPTQVFDFKFGNAGLSNSRIDNIYTQVGSSNFPVSEIRPGSLPIYTNGLGAAYNLSQDIGGLFGSGNTAGGGFVIYPSKPNTNMLQSVYTK